MTTQEVADKLVQLCRAGKHMQAYDELYNENAVSHEPYQSSMPLTRGLDALREKTQYFFSTVDTMHENEVSDPLVAGNFFSITMGMKFTSKEGKVVEMGEVCVYEVNDGKIVKEQFFF
ncbi:MAG: nuclear transport factor 2 family protein [Bacteroidetes bacterium]|nr:nuclear transport factor 2 family protein [Bacteroidota bacterium]